MQLSKGNFMINQFVTLLATFIGEGPNATRVAWVVTIVLALFALWLLRWLFNWFFKANEILANQEHIIELLEARPIAVAAARQGGVPAGLNMRPPAPLPTAPVGVAPMPIRQHPIDDEFSEILNVRPHNVNRQTAAAPPPAPVPASRGVATAPAQPVNTSPSLRPPTLSNAAVPNVAVPSATLSDAAQQPTVMASSGIEPGQLMEETNTMPFQAQPANTSVTMLGSPEARAERQMDAQEAMRLAEQAANSTLSKTADIPDIPTALVRTHSSSKTNPLTGRRVADRSVAQPESENGDAVPSQFQLRNRKS